MTSQRKDVRRTPRTPKGICGATPGVDTNVHEQTQGNGRTDSIIDRTPRIVDDLYQLADDLADRAWRSKSAEFSSAAIHMTQAFAHAYHAWKKLDAIGDPVGEDQEGTPQ